MKSNRNDAFQDKSIKVPFVVPNIDNSDKKAIITALQSNLLTDGPTLRKFENSFCDLTGSKYAIGVSNATAALQLSLKSLKIGKDDEVIIPDMTFVATANAVLFTGATPILADINFEDLNISVESIKKNMSSKTKAIIPVHFAGKSCNMKEIRKIAKQYHVKIIEDCAQAQGAKFKNKYVGSFGDVGCFSFYPTKILGAYGDGGFISTNSINLYKKVKQIRFYGIEQNNKKNKFNNKYYANEHGINSRISEIQLSILNLKLPQVNSWIKQRRKLPKVYSQELKDTSLKLPVENINCKHVFHLYVVYHPKRDKIIKKLKENNIQVNINYPFPIHKMKAYKNKVLNKSSYLPTTEKMANGIFSLPLYPKLKKTDVFKI